MLSVPSDRPVNPLTAEVLGEIAAVSARVNVPYVLVGAMARDILLDRIYGVEAVTATTDIDIAISVSSGPTFLQFRNALLATGRFELRSSEPYKISYKAGVGKLPYPVDLIPFGAIADESHTVTVPPEGGANMNVIGYEEAEEACIEIQVSSTVITRVISIPSLAALKLLAWRDRRHRSQNPKDAADFGLVLLNYTTLGNKDRLVAECFDTLEAVTYHFDVAAAHLLGADVRKTMRPHTTTAILEILSGAWDRSRLLNDMASRKSAGTLSIDFGELECRLAQFESGLSGAAALPYP